MHQILSLKINGRGRPKRTWKKRVGEESVKVGLRMEDAPCQSKWIVDVNRIAAVLTRIWPPILIVNTTRFYILVSLFE